MDIDLLKTFGITILIFGLAGVILFVPLVKFLCYLKGTKPNLSYKHGLLWGVLTGILFTLFNYLIALYK